MLDFDNIEHFVKERLHQQLLAPPADSWSKVSRALDQKKNRSRLPFIVLTLFFAFIPFSLRIFSNKTTDRFSLGEIAIALQAHTRTHPRWPAVLKIITNNQRML